MAVAVTVDIISFIIVTGDAVNRIPSSQINIEMIEYLTVIDE